MHIEAGKTYTSHRRNRYRVIRVENDKVHCVLGTVALVYDLDQFIRMVAT